MIMPVGEIRKIFRPTPHLLPEEVADVEPDLHCLTIGSLDRDHIEPSVYQELPTFDETWEVVFDPSLTVFRPITANLAS
jgi:hypothetical protein